MVKVSVEITAVRPSWVAPSRPNKGQDHLGLAGVSMLLYAPMLPLITNVTPRAAYFSFYPWVLYEYSQLATSKDSKEWKRFLRTADFLYTLIAFSHDCETDGSRAMTGRDKVRDVIAEWEKKPDMLRDLAPYTDLGGPSSYFKNSTGGLGQYYASRLRALKLLGSEDTSFGVPLLGAQRGIAITQVFQSRREIKDFLAILTSKRVSLTRLRELGKAWCTCALRTRTAESRMLTEYLFDQGGELRAEAQQQTFQACLSGVGQFPAKLKVARTQEVAAEFIQALYFGYYREGTEISMPPKLQKVAGRWRAVQAHEFFAGALRNIFWAALRELEDHPDGKRVGISLSELNTLVASAASKGLTAGKSSWGEIRLNHTLDATIAHLAKRGAKDRDWAGDPASESNLEENGYDVTALIAKGLVMLCRLIVRWRGDKELQASHVLEPRGENYYRINLRRLVADAEECRQRPLSDFLQLLLTKYIVHQHSWIAVNKLGHQAQDTFKFSLEEDVIRFIAPPEGRGANIRLNSAFQILFDLGLYEFKGNSPRLLDTGRDLLKSAK